MKPSDLHRVGMCCAILLFGGLALASPPDGGYHLLKKYALGAAPGGKEYWDYITFDASGTTRKSKSWMRTAARSSEVFRI